MSLFETQLYDENDPDLIDKDDISEQQLKQNSAVKIFDKTQD